MIHKSTRPGYESWLMLISLQQIFNSLQNVPEKIILGTVKKTIIPCGTQKYNDSIKGFAAKAQSINTCTGKLINKSPNTP